LKIINFIVSNKDPGFPRNLPGLTIKQLTDNYITFINATKASSGKFNCTLNYINMKTNIGNSSSDYVYLPFNGGKTLNLSFASLIFVYITSFCK
jgi:hypothetical protein